MTVSTAIHDTIVIGGGHNGLTTAAYLARAGRRVRVLEARSVVGGAAVTEEFIPGFRNSTASYTVSLLHPKVIADLQLHQHGLQIVHRPLPNFMPLPDGRALLNGNSLQQTQAEFAKFSAADADRLPAYYDWLEGAANVLRSQLLHTPPNLGGGWRDWWRSGRLALAIRSQSAASRQAIFELFTRSAAELLEQWFENPHIQALFGFDAIVGHFASPYEAGSGYVLLHHVFGEVNGRSGAWGHAIGGMGAISNAIAASATKAGAIIECDKPVIHIKRVDATVLEVETEDGHQYRSKSVAANCTPKRLMALCQDDVVTDETRASINRTRYGSGTFRMNVALSALPSFTAQPHAGAHLSAGIIIGPTLDYMARAFEDARREGWSAEPVIEMLIPSTLDDTLAPSGQHVASLFCQHVQPQMSDGRQWPDLRDEVARHMLSTVERYAPGFVDSVIGYEALSPYDLETRLGLTNGDIFHGALTPAQLFSARPAPTLADYRIAMPGIYLCGSGAHPGGGVSGLPGHNAAREILRDL